MNTFIEQHRATLDPSNPRDYIDAFLIELNALADSKDEHSFFGETEAIILLWN